MKYGHVFLACQQGEGEHGTQHRGDHGRVAGQAQVVVLTHVAGQRVQAGVVGFQRIDGEQIECARVEERDAGYKVRQGQVADESVGHRMEAPRSHYGYEGETVQAEDQRAQNDATYKERQLVRFFVRIFEAFGFVQMGQQMRQYICSCVISNE